MLILYYDDTITVEQLQQLKLMVQRRQQLEPLAYIIGYKEFYSLNFTVTPAVLIPRPDSEILVDLAIKYGKQKLEQVEITNDKSQYNILDLGTGSGCLLIAIVNSLLTFESSSKIQGIGVDISFEALAIAKENIQQHNLEKQCNLILSDFFQNISNSPTAKSAKILNFPTTKFNLIISNPPYIAKNELSNLMPDVSNYEPLNALSDMADGLSHYRTIISQLDQHLAIDGVAILEHGYLQRDGIKEIIQQYSKTLELIKEASDLQGHPRAVVIKLKST